jgi:hypothetical protein
VRVDVVDTLSMGKTVFLSILKYIAVTEKSVEKDVAKRRTI